MDFQTNVKTGDVKISEGSTPAPEVKPDLITRVSQVKKEEPKLEVIQGEVTEPEFDFKDIEKITDPTAKEYAENAYKSFQRGFNKKFQEIAEIRKSLEGKKQESVAWTPDRINQLLNDSTFVEAAKQVAQTQAPSTFEGTQEEWSSLSDGDKVKFKQLENKIAQLEQQNYQSHLKQQDESLKSKYANYQPEALDIITAELLTGKRQATREDLWRVYDYEDAVTRAYELGKKDASGTNREKSQATTIEGITTQANTETPKPDKGENDRDYFKRLFLGNASKFKDTGARK